jgi:two-component system, cell cycle sensor histidine kinase and response regulator CckA
MAMNPTQSRRILQAAAGFAALAGLYAVSRHNYLLFHGLAELFAVAVAWSVFFLLWNTRRLEQNDALLLLGIAYFSVGFIDLVHTLSYKGMGIFVDDLAANHATQLWIAARGLEAVSLLLFPLLLGRRIRTWPVFCAYTGITALLLASIFTWNLFPACYIEGVGLTGFKVGTEYVICLTLVLAMGLLFKKRELLDPAVARLMIAAMALTIAEELAFTLYTDVYGLMNLAGHLLKIVSFFLIYLALVRSTVARPLETMFQTLSRDKERLQEAEETYRGIFLNSQVGLFRTDVGTGELLDANDAVARFLGYPNRGGLLAESFNIAERYVDPEDRRKMVSMLESQGEFQNFEARFRRNDGSILWMRYSARLVPEKGWIEGVSEDVTERKQTEEKLRESERKWRNILVNTPQIGISLDPEAKIVFANKHFLALTGWTEDEVLGQNWFNNFIPEECREEIRSVFQTVMQTGDTKSLSSYENEILTRRGDRRYVAWANNVTKDVQGAIVDVTCLGIDLTERKYMEEKLSKSESQIRHHLGLVTSLINSIPDIVFYKNLDGTYLGCNAEFVRHLGKEIDDILGKTDYDLYDRSEADAFRENDRLMLEQESPRHNEEWIRYPGGRRVLLDTLKAPLRDSEGKLIGMLGVARNITEQRKTEEKLRLQALVLDQISDRVTVTDLKGVITYVNEADVKALGYSRDELLGVSTEKFGEDPERGATQREIIEKTLSEGRWRGEVVNFAADGSEIVMDCRTQVVHDDIGNPIALAGIATEITERKQWEKALQDTNARAVAQRKALVALTEPETMGSDDSEAALRFLTEQASMAMRVDRVGVWLFSEDGAEMHCATQFESSGKVHTRGAVQITANYPKYWEAIRKDSYINADDAQKDSRTAEFLDDLLIPMGITSMLDAGIQIDGRIKGVVCFEHTGPQRIWQADEQAFVNTIATIAAQILVNTERRRVDADRERLTTAIEQAGEAVVITDPKGIIQYINPAFERITGYAREEVLGQNPRILKSGQQDEVFYQTLWDIILRGDTWRGKMVNKKKNGTLYTEEAVISPVTDTQGRIAHFVAVKKDVTRELALKNQLHQAQKVESIGRLAGGVAHDLNNLLSPILGYAEMLREDLASEDTKLESVDEILNAGMKARDLVRQLLAFSRKQTLELKRIEINTVLKNFRKLLRRTIREDIEIKYNLEPAPLQVMADVNQMEQVIMNLAVNAADAMPTGGFLTIETARATLDEEYAGMRPGVKPGDYLLLAFSDTGCGMDDYTRENIFEPFFSTKGEQGTGLGLSTVYGIIKQHNGNIWVYSEPDKRTTFKVYLPLAGDADVPSKALTKPTKNLKGSECVLLVEDNDQVRHLANAILNRQGYRVILAKGGDEAIKALEQHDCPLHLLLTDVVMPGMNGKVLFEKIRKSYPDIKVLYMSGYTTNVIAHSGILDEGVQFIQKPFTVKGLAEKIRIVLDIK